MASFAYPGVYIEEISSGQHTISGVATSIAAFIGWSNQGPTGTPTMVESWLQYQALFGGFISGNYLGYAVYQFFANGGSQAYIIRLVDPTTSATASSTIGGLQLYANNPGAWANSVNVAITQVNAAGSDVTFNLQVTNAKGQTLENYTNLSASPKSASFAVAIINADSEYISFTPTGTTTAPTAIPAYTVAGSVAGVKVFTAGEIVTQGGGASAVVVGAVAAGGPMLITPYSGAPAAGNWTGQSSGAVFDATGTPTAVIQNATATALNAGTGPTSGADGNVLQPNDGGTFENQLTGANGYALLSGVPIFNLLCVPGENYAGIVPNMQTFCQTYRAFLITDAPLDASPSKMQTSGPVDYKQSNFTLTEGSYGAYYYPWIQAPDPQAGFRPALFPPCGYVAGMYAATDANRGVWKAPAGIQAGLAGSLGLQAVLDDIGNGQLNTWGINCLRQFPVYGNVIWGARTMDGADAKGSQYKYVPIRRLANFIESSLYQGTQWVVFEPNAEPLWGQIRLSINTFLQDLFLKGAFAGTSPQQAYFVKCDADNNPDSQIALGVVNITVGFAPLYPAEFVVIQITQMSNS